MLEDAARALAAVPPASTTGLGGGHGTGTADAAFAAAPSATSRR